MNKKVIPAGIEIYSPVTDVSTDIIFKFLEEILTSLEDELTEEDENLKFSMRTTFRVNTPAIIRFHTNGNDRSETMDKIIRIIDQITPKYVRQNQGTMEVAFDVQSVENDFLDRSHVAEPTAVGRSSLLVGMQG
jgi:hypothetical protein